jgi:hypothetical protein
MKTLIKIIHQKYNLIAYLFFIKNNQIYLPIKPVHFERAFKRLNINLPLVNKCSWENYRMYLTINNSIKEFLISKGIEDVRLVDAHSFLWLLSSFNEIDNSIYNFVKTDKAINDLNRFNMGDKAEASVFKYEQNLISGYGFKDKIDCVKLVSSNYSLGYDIISIDEEKKDKYIEVKSVTEGDIKTFHMSENQIKTLNKLDNYFIYLVENPGNKRERIFILKDPDLDNAPFTKTARNIYENGKLIKGYRIEWMAF